MYKVIMRNDNFKCVAFDKACEGYDEFTCWISLNGMFVCAFCDAVFAEQLCERLNGLKLR